MLVLRCRDVGFDCQAVVRGATQEEVLRQAAEHAAKVHGVQVTPEVAEAVAKAIHEEGGQDNRR